MQGDEISDRKNALACCKIRGPQLAVPPAGTRVRSPAGNNLVAWYEGSGPRVKASRNPAELVGLHHVYRDPLKPTAPDIPVIWEKVKGPGGPRPDPASTTDTTAIFVAGNLEPRRPRAGLDKWAGVRTDLAPDVVAKLRRERPSFDVTPPDLLPAEAVEAFGLAKAGATLPCRDATDEGLVRQDPAGTGRVIMSQEDVGGYRMQSGGGPRRTPSPACG